MTNWILAISFLALLSGVFVFKRLWLGALIAIGILLFGKVILINSADFHLPLGNGLIISLELALLLSGAYLFYSVLLSSNHFDRLTEIFGNYSSRLPVALILCLFLGSFMEGVAGFGIPGMLIAPLMLTAGFKPMTCITLPLAIPTTAVTFGALGTPLKIGLGISVVDETVTSTVFVNMLPALTLPFVLALLYSKTEGIRINLKKESKMLAGAGLCFSAPYLMTGLYNIEYPSIAAGAGGLLLFNTLFIPEKEKPSLKSWYNIFWPYLLFVALLISAKIIAGSNSWTIHEHLKMVSFFQPGIVFIFSAVLVAFIQNRRQVSSRIIHQCKSTLQRIARPLLTIFLLVCFTQLINKDLSAIMHATFLTVRQELLFLIVPLTGVMGSFITGSATMSVLLFSGWVHASSTAAHLPLSLALLNTGGAAGNAISLQNIVMVKSVVNQRETDGRVLGYTVIALAAYLLMVMISVLIILITTTR